MLKFAIKKEITFQVMVKEYSRLDFENHQKSEIKFDVIAIFDNIGYILPEGFAEKLKIENEIFEYLEKNKNIKEIMK